MNLEHPLTAFAEPAPTPPGSTRAATRRTELDRSAISRLLRRSDYWRRSPAVAGGRAGHKEWSHFCVLTQDLDLLVNFSLMDDLPQGGVARVEVPRVALLLREGDRGWFGGVREIDRRDSQIEGGKLGLVLGDCSIDYDSESASGYRVRASLTAERLHVDLQFEPQAMPALTTSIGLSRGAYMKWLVVPRMRARGVIRHRGREHRLEAAPAYHDHDWGAFDWGGDFAWEWAVVPPPVEDCLWSLVYMRISDRSRNRVLAQGVLLWRGDAHSRTFRGRDLSVSLDGWHESPRVRCFPPVISLAIESQAFDLPATLTAEARSGRDWLSLRLETDNSAQIGIPNDVGGRGVTLLTEARASAFVEGEVRGEAFSYRAPAFLEVNHDS